jgi:hypothetical protein
MANKPVNMPMPAAEMPVTARKPHPPAIEHDALTSVPTVSGTGVKTNTEFHR